MKIDYFTNQIINDELQIKLASVRIFSNKEMLAKVILELENTKLKLQPYFQLLEKKNL